MVSVQVHGPNKAVFVANGSVILCSCCQSASPSVRTIIDMQTNINRVQPAVWQQYLLAVTEKAVVETEKRLQPLIDIASLQVNKPLSPMEQVLIDLEALILPKCSQCHQTLPDFEACLALVCGQTSVGMVGGCGASLCGYCQRSFPDEWAVHAHLRSDCALNPHKGNMFPQSDFQDILRSAARERVWYCDYVYCNLSLVTHACRRWHIMLRTETAQVDDVFARADQKWPEIGLTKEWCAKRLRWTLLCDEMKIDALTFADNLPSYMRCEAQCVDMGFPQDAAMRAAILQKGDVTQAAIVLCENQQR